eukprot:424639_1
MSQKTTTSKKKKKKSKHSNKRNKNKALATSYDDIHHAIEKKDKNTNFVEMLKNITDDKILIGYGHTIHTLLYFAATKPNIEALMYLIKECKKRFNGSNTKHTISSVLNNGYKSQKKQENGKQYQITPLAKILLTLRKDHLTESQRLEYRHMALLLIGNGVDVNCKSVMEPHKDQRKNATDYQIVEPIEIAFSLYDPELFLAIMFQNIDQINYKNSEEKLDENPLITIQRKV